ncbi:hypothetical protein FRB93_010887 [Tulasnella sp. JGI-2019a]|nr:hypothetical protein FRB93_010887 [Tulasnella sp. JGI-2019a]
MAVGCGFACQSIGYKPSVWFRRMPPQLYRAPSKPISWPLDASCATLSSQPYDNLFPIVVVLARLTSYSLLAFVLLLAPPLMARPIHSSNIKRAPLVLNDLGRPETPKQPNDINHVNGQFEAQPRPDSMAFPAPYYYHPPSTQVNSRDYPNPGSNVDGILTQHPPFWSRPMPAPITVAPGATLNTRVNREDGVLALLADMSALHGQKHETSDQKTVRVDSQSPAELAQRETKKRRRRKELVDQYLKQFKADYKDKAGHRGKQSRWTWTDYTKMLYTQGSIEKDFREGECPCRQLEVGYYVQSITF